MDNENDDTIITTLSTPPPPPAEQLSIESLLSIPLQLILKGTSCDTTPSPPQRKRRPLLLRSEAFSLLQINLLSNEIDTLIRLTVQTLGRMHGYRKYGRRILHSTSNRNNHNHFYLISLLPLLHTCKQTHKSSLLYLSQQIWKCLQKLRYVQTSLRQYSEQHLSIADQLLDFDTTNNHKISRENRIIGEMEYEICSRIDLLFDTTASADGDGEDGGNALDLICNEEGRGNFIPMKEFCQRCCNRTDCDNESKIAEIKNKEEEEEEEEEDSTKSSGSKDNGSKMALVTQPTISPILLPPSSKDKKKRKDEETKCSDCADRKVKKSRLNDTKSESDGPVSAVLTID